VAQLYPQAPGSLFIAFYYSQDCAEIILTCLTWGLLVYILTKINIFITRRLTDIKKR
jgi:cadmium resistance protein CadD (predicted permease)